MTYPLGDEVLDLRMQAAQDTDELARLRRGLQATHQALLDERAAGQNAFVMAAAGHAFASSWPAGAEHETEGPLRDLLVAHRATTPSQTPATHVIVAVDELERLKKANVYLQEYLDGYLDMDDLEDVRETKGRARGQVADYLAECADHGEAPEHDGGAS